MTNDSLLFSTDNLTDHGKIRLSRCMERAIHHFTHSKPRQNQSHAILSDVVDILLHERKETAASVFQSPVQSLLDVVDGNRKEEETVPSDLCDFQKRIYAILTPENRRFVKGLKDDDLGFLADNKINKQPSQRQLNWLTEIEDRVRNRKELFTSLGGFGQQP